MCFFGATDSYPKWKHLNCAVDLPILQTQQNFHVAQTVFQGVVCGAAEPVTCLAFSVAGNLYRSWVDGFEGTANESNK